MIDLSKVESKLGKFEANSTPFKQKMNYLSEEYPRLFIYILEFFQMTDEID